MLLIVMVLSLLVSAASQQVDNEWRDPYNMLNYTQRPASHSNETTRRRGYIQAEAVATSCTKQVEDLQKQSEDQQKVIVLMSQQPTCNSEFKKFLSRLLKEIQRVGVPTDSTDVFYDAKIKVSPQAMMEIQTLLDGEESWRTGALANAIRQIQIGLGVLIIVVIISTELWWRISWFKYSVRLLIVCFLVSIVLNWLSLYKIAFAEHQNNVVKMDGVNEKCAGVKKIDWTDNLTEWYRSTWTLQDDPCKKYYDMVYINPILLVSPTKAIAVTITTFITEPLKHIGQGINEALQVLLKDLSVTMVFFTIMLAFMVFVFMVNQDRDEFAERDALGPEYAPQLQPDDARNNVQQRQSNKSRKEQPRVAVETLRLADHSYSDDEADVFSG